MAADLTITMDDGTTTVAPGTSTSYTITVSNTSLDAITGALVFDQLASNVTAATWTAVTTINGVPTGSTTSGSGLINQPVDLPVGGAVIFTFNVLVDPSAPAGPLINTALASFLLNGGVTLIQHIATDTDTLTPQADLAVTIDDHTLIVVPGASDGYTITVTNNGPSTVAVLP